MYRSAPALFLLCALPLAACGGETAPEAEAPPAAAVETPAAEQAPAELTQAADAYVAAWNGTDPAAVVAFFTEDATAVLGDSTYTGREQIAEKWINGSVAVVKDLSISNMTTTRSGEDWIAAGDYSHAATMEGSTAPETGRFESTWRRQADGSWKIVSEKIAPNMPADSAAAPAAEPAS